MSRPSTLDRGMLVGHNPLEFSFNFDSPAAGRPQRTPLSNLRAKPSVAVMVAAVACRYCCGLFRNTNANGKFSEENFVCIHCVEKIEHEVHNTNSAVAENPTPIPRQLPTTMAKAAPAQLRIKAALVDSCSQTTTVCMVDCSTQTETNSEGKCCEDRTDRNVDTPHSCSYTCRNIAGDLTEERSHFTHGSIATTTSPNTTSLPGRSVLIVGSSNVALFGRYVHAILPKPARSRVRCCTRDKLSEVVSEVRRYVGLQRPQISEKFVIVQIGLDNVLEMLFHQNIREIWRLLDTHLNAIIDLCYEYKVKLTICSIPVVSGCGTIDRKSDCRYLNELVAGKLAGNTQAGFLNLAYIQRQRGTRGPDGFHLSSFGARLAAKSIGHIISQFLDVGLMAHRLSNSPLSSVQTRQPHRKPIEGRRSYKSTVYVKSVPKTTADKLVFSKKRSSFGESHHADQKGISPPLFSG